MNWKGYGRKQSWHFHGGTDKNNDNLSQDSRSPSQNLNPGPSEYLFKVSYIIASMFSDHWRGSRKKIKLLPEVIFMEETKSFQYLNETKYFVHHY
jgi:hypothetical protein